MKLTRHALLFLTLLAGVSSASAPCTAANFGDGVCDCGCGTADADCPPRPAGQSAFTVCEQSHCVAGQVPWEHAPASCMNSACGDGWVDAAAGEVCDDHNALASGGCAANCRSVNAGYVCGAGAAGCRLAPADAGPPVVDAGVADAGAPDAGAPDAGTTSGADAGDGNGLDGGVDEAPGGAMPRTGCSAIGVELLGLAGLLLRRRKSAAA